MVNEILDRMNISHRARHFPQQLSEVSSSASPSPAPWWPTRSSSSPTSPPETSTRRTGKEVMDLLTELNKEGTTVVMVTHSQHDSYASRTIDLFDGEIVTDENLPVIPPQAKRPFRLDNKRSCRHGSATFSSYNTLKCKYLHNNHSDSLSDIRILHDY